MDNVLSIRLSSCTVGMVFNRRFFSLHPSFGSPTTPNITPLTAHRTTPPAATKPKAVRCPHPSSILSASIFWTATAHATPRRTQSMPPPSMERKLNTNVMLERLTAESVAKLGFALSDLSPYFQTTIKMGNKDMQELTNRAVDMELGFGFFGGAGSGPTVLPPDWALGPLSLLCSSFAAAPSFQAIDSQRMVRC